jgi:hypothetical protein
MKNQNGAEKTYAIFLPESGLEKGFSTASTYSLRGAQNAQHFGRPDRSAC